MAYALLHILSALSLPMSIEKKKRNLVAVAIIAPFCLLVLVTGLVLRAISQAEAATDAVLHTHNLIARLQTTASLMKDIETSQRGFLLTGRDDFLDSHREAMALLPAARHGLAELAAMTPDEAERFARLERLIDAKLQFVDQTISARRSDPRAAVQLVQGGEGKRLMDGIRGLIRDMEADEAARLQARLFESDRRHQLKYHAALAIMAIDLIMLGVVFLLLIKLKNLRQLVTVCAWTKEVKHEGRWVALEEFLKAKFNFDTSHSISERAAKDLRAQRSPAASS